MDVDDEQVAGRQEPLPIGGDWGGFPWGGGWDWVTQPPGPSVRLDQPSACTEGAGPGQCVWVAPKTVASTGYRVDGRMGTLPSGEAEYHGSVSLPYEDQQVRRTGEVRVMVTRAPGSRGLDGYVLRVAGEVPAAFWTWPLDRGPQPGTGELAVVFDLQRLRYGSKWAAGRDLRVVLDLWRGTARWERPQWWFGRGSWRETEPRGRSAVQCEFRGGGNATCRFEVSLELSAQDLSPTAGGRAAVGLGLVTVGDQWRGGRRGPDGSGGLPAELARRARRDGTDQASLDRTLLTTVVFGPPPSAPLKVASFNVARFGPVANALLGSPFPDIPVEEVAEAIEGYDLVALQELWRTKDAQALLAAANERRAARGQPPMKLYGPPRFERSELQYMLDRLPGVVRTVAAANPGTAVASFLRESIQTMLDSGDTHGGVWIMTHLPVYATGYQRYHDGGALLSNSRCRGEDCFKAKGVVWVRVGLTPRPADGNCVLDEPGVQGSCGVPPTGDQYLDVFATHLQAKKPFLCKVEDAINNLSGEQHAWVTALTELMGGGDQCLTTTDWGVQRAQLRQLAAYVDAVSDGRRPALLLGDFNIDGRRLGNSSGAGEYGAMLDILGVAPVSVDTGAEAPADWLQADPDARRWDLDHGDVAREEFDARWWTQCGVGTSIGKGGGDASSEWEEGSCRAHYWSDPECQARGGRFRPREGMTEADCAEAWYRCDLPGDKRIDYIFVRPPRRVGSAGWVPDYEVGKDHLSAGPVWYTDYPERWPDASPLGPGAPVCGGAPDWSTYPGRLSDHRLVAARLRFFRQRVPGAYHPDWNHRVTVRVESYEALDTVDCPLLCGVTDPYPKLQRSWLADPMSPEVEGPEHAGSVCGGRYAVSYPVDDCTADWAVQFEQRVEGDPEQQRVRVGLWEADDTSPDDHTSLYEVPHDVRWQMDFRRQMYSYLHDLGDAIPFDGQSEWRVRTSDPLRICFEDEVRACLAVSWEEY